MRIFIILTIYKSALSLLRNALTVARKMQRLFKIIPVILILVVGIWGWNHLANSDEDTADSTTNPALSKEAKKQRRKEKALANAQQTSVLKLTAVDFTVQLTSHGIVRPLSITTLSPQVPGIVQSVSPAFENGSFVKKGDTLLTLDPADSESQIATAAAALARAEAALAQEVARAAQALRNWKDIGFDTAPNDLVLRKPQLKEANANVAAQTAALEKAQRDLTRTQIKAPFDGRIRSRKIGVAESVNLSTALGEIYPTGFAEVRLPLSNRQLGKLQLDELNLTPIPVAIRDAIHPENTTVWHANIVRIEGELDPTSRELFVIARIEDPFGLHALPKRPPLRMNQPITAIIKGLVIKNAIKIPRMAIYGENQIILVKNNTVLRKTITPIWATESHIITSSEGLEGNFIATSKLAYAPDGAPVRIIAAPQETSK